MSRVDLWYREPGKPFPSLEREQYAQARAKGLGIGQASAAAGISVTTGSQYERHNSVRTRIGELRQTTDAYVGVSAGWVIAQLMKNVEEARENNAFKASNEALALIYKMITEDKSVTHNMARMLPHHVTPQQLQQKLKESFRQRELEARAGDSADEEEAG